MPQQNDPQKVEKKPVFHPSSHISAYPKSVDDEISLTELWYMLLFRKRMIAVITVITTIMAVTYSVITPSVYRVEALVKPQGDYGREAIATLQSVAFMESYIFQETLLPWIFRNKWDAQNGVWAVKNDGIPSLRQGALAIQERLIIDEKEQLTAIGLQSTDPSKAFKVVNQIIQRLNDAFAENAYGKAEKKIKHYKNQLFSFDSLFVKRIAPEAISRTDGFLLKNNGQDAVINYLQAQLINSGSISERRNLIEKIQSNENVVMRVLNERDEFALKVFDPASVPDKDEKIWPKPFLIIFVGFIGGGGGGCMFALVLGFIKEIKNK